MKKNILKSLLFAVALTPVLTGCEFDQYPSTSIPNENSWGTVDDAEKFANGIKSSIRSISMQDYYYADYFVDYYQITTSYGNRNGLVYNWNFQASDVEGEWSDNFSRIANANNVINNIGTIVAETDDEQTTLNQYLGEAYVLRAWCNFSNIQRYCGRYDASTATAENSGVPILEESDINAKPARNTLQESYDAVLADLQKAEDLITANETGTDAINADVINFLRARVYITMNDYQNAYDIATSLIDGGNYQLCDGADALIDMFTNDTGSEVVYVGAATTSEYATWNSYVQYYSTSVAAYAPDMIPSAATMADYSDEDARLEAYFMYAHLNNNDVECDAYILDKFRNNEAINLSSDDEYTRKNVPPGMRIAEMYLIAAEAAYQLGNTAKAQEYLNDLRSTRGLENMTVSGNTLFNAIKTEWKREFIAEGKRLFCLKRWGDGFTRNATSQSGAAGNVYQTNPEINIALSVDASNYKWTWAIPTNELETNSNMVQNPGWGN